MAIRVQHGRKRPYFVYWINPFTGRRESVSCETREEAEKQDALVKYQLKYERDAFRRSVAPEPPPAAHTLESVMYLYLKERRLTLHNLEKTLHAAALRSAIVAPDAINTRFLALLPSIPIALSTLAASTSPAT